MIQTLLVAAVLSTGAGPERDGVDADRDKAAIRLAALDYAEGFYQGRKERMARAVHPALLKRGLLPPGATDRFLQLLNAETLIDLTERERERPPAEHRLDFALLDLRTTSRRRGSSRSTSTTTSTSRSRTDDGASSTCSGRFRAPQAASRTRQR